MTSRDFCYWLQGYFEMSVAETPQDKPISWDQIRCIKQHLALVFVHEIDPSAGDAANQAKLNEIHNKPPLKDVVYRC